MNPHAGSTTSKWCTGPASAILARRTFELLGMRVVDRGGRWMLALADPAVADVANNVRYAVGGDRRAVVTRAGDRRGGSTDPTVVIVFVGPTTGASG